MTVQTSVTSTLRLLRAPRQHNMRQRPVQTALQETAPRVISTVRPGDGLQRQPAQGRNSNYTTRYLNLDTNVLKKIAITERWKAELRGEFFNITNNQNFDTPSTFKDITVYGATTNFLNTTLQTGGSRTFRVGGKLIF